MHTFHRGEQNHISALLTQRPKLWIFNCQTFWIHRQGNKKKRWHCKNVLTPALSRHQDFMNVFLITITSVKLQSYFIWNSPTYSVEQHSDKACTLCKTEVKFIQASGSCWWLWDVFFFFHLLPAMERWATRRFHVSRDGRHGDVRNMFFFKEKYQTKERCNCRRFVSLVQCFPISNDPPVEIKEWQTDLVCHNAWIIQKNDPRLTERQHSE